MTRVATQSQSDGELFATIENGIRLTGMPALGAGTAESAYGSWGLIHFIRQLPKITPEEPAGMEPAQPEVTRRMSGGGVPRAERGRRTRKGTFRSLGSS